MGKKHRRSGTNFWDAEYQDGGHLALSESQSEDLEKFTRWLMRERGKEILNVTASALDLGCGNGRNLIWLSETFGVRGVGYDTSSEAIAQAKRRSAALGLPLAYDVRSIAEPLPLPDSSQSIVLDLMTSHFLSAAERTKLVDEVNRVLKPGGFLCYKTFLLDEDRHAARMLREHPASEPNTYIHPVIGVAEHVSTEAEIEDTYGRTFTLHKIHRSHRHKGKDAKRRSIIVYLEKPKY